MRTKTPQIIISSVGVAALAIAFALWCSDSNYGAEGMTAAVVSVVCFAAVCLKTVPVWLDSFNRPSESENAAKSGACLKIFLGFLAWDAFIILAVFVFRAYMGNTDSFVQSLDFWKCTDSQHYLAIAEDWYLSSGSIDRLVQLVFLPGYPIIVRLFSYITGDSLTAGLLVSALCFALSGCVLYRLVLLDGTHLKAMRAVKYFAICPAVFFFVCPMSESLFVLCCLSCILLVRRGKALAGCAVGAYAAFTRSPGMVLLVPVVLELIRHRAKWTEYLKTLIIPLGFAAYLYVNYLVSGDAFKFMQYQQEHWNQSFGWFFNTAAYQCENALYSLGQGSVNFYGLWLPNLLSQLLALTLIFFAAGKMRPSYTACFIAYFAVTMGATWLLSAPRYLAGLFVMPIAMSAVSSKKCADTALTTLSLVLGVAYLSFFVLRWQVW